MKFLERQESARQRTRILQVQFALLAVLALGLSFALALCLGYVLTMAESAILRALGILAQPPAFATLCLGAAVHAAYLLPLTLRANRRRGKQALADLAEALESRGEANPRSDSAHRKLQNVVEEMALASGMPAPRVRLWSSYPAINSVTLGYAPADATIHVTRLAVDGLARPELQALVAYSMSQICNGDMALSMRLASYVHWFRIAPRLAIWLAKTPHRERGHVVMSRFFFWLFICMPLAVALLAVSWPPLLAAEFLQSRVGRERQRLADASVLQFTRDQQPLEDLLLKALAYSSNSRRPHALPGLMEDFAHCCFVAPNVFRILAPQEPIAARLRALNPRMDVPVYPSAELDEVRQKVRDRLALAAERRDESPPKTAPIEDALKIVPIVLASARGVEPPLRLSGLDDSTAGLLALLLERNPAIRARQIAALTLHSDESSIAAVKRAFETQGDVAPAERSLAMDRRLPHLRELPAHQVGGVRDCVVMLEFLDDTVDVFEFALARSVRVFIDGFSRPRQPHGSLSLDAVQGEIILLFATLAAFSSKEHAGAAFDTGMRQLGINPRPNYRVISSWAKPMDHALARLDQLTPMAKNLLLDGMAKTALYDGFNTLAERELVRAVATCLHCPVPRAVAAN